MKKNCRIAKITEWLLSVIYPSRCAICDDIIYFDEKGICEKCARKVRYAKDPYCMKCGKPIEDETEEYCSDCMEKRHVFDEGRSVFVYDENTSVSMYRFKYNARREYSVFYAQQIYKRLGRKISSWNADVLIPVPIHKKRLKKRGYNQAALIANELSKLINIPVNDKLISRKVSTSALKNLSSKERQNNLKKAFIVNKNSVKLRTAIIIDDIYTTGSTVDSISECLRLVGFERVYVVTVCIGQGY